MHSENEMQRRMFSYFYSKQRASIQHALRAIKAHADAAFPELPSVLDLIYSKISRSSIPPELL